MSILDVIEREWLTPRALRTLSPRSVYIGRYEGGPMRSFVTAYVKTFGRKQVEGFYSDVAGEFPTTFA